MNKNLRFLSIVCTLLLLPLFNFAQTQFWSDTFEDTGAPSSGSRTPSMEQGVGSPKYTSYFLRTDGSNINLNAPVDPGSPTSYQNFQGSKFWAGEDLDNAGLGGTKIQTITWSSIDISGKSGLSIKGLFAASNDRDWQNFNFGPTYDFMEVEYRIDGGSWTLAGGIYPDASNGIYGRLREDTNGDKIGDGSILLSRNFQEFVWNIAGTGTTLDLRFKVSADASAVQEFAIDNFRLFTTGTGVSLSSKPTLTFSNATGLGDYIASDGDGGSDAISDIDIQIYDISDVNGTKQNTLTWKDNDFLYSSDDSYSGLTTEINPDSPLQDQSGSKGTLIKSSDGSEFKLISFKYYNWGETSSFINTVKGYRNGTEVASTTFDGFDTDYDPITVTLPTTFSNVDEVRMYISGGGYVGDQTLTNHSINNIKLGPADTSPTNTAPTLTTTGGNTAFTEGTAVAIDNGITVTDADNSTLASATVSITGGFQLGQDVLSFTNDGSTMGNITAAYFGGTGVLNLSSDGNTATTEQWKAALRAVKYNNVSDNPNNANRTISFVINDGTANSSTVTKTVSITAANDAPTATNLTQSKSALEGSSAVALDDIVVSDPDGGEIITATLTLSNASAGTLSTGTYGSATSTFNTGTGVWTVNGSVSDVNAALAAVAFAPSANNDQNFSITTRIRDAAGTGPVDGTISFTVTGVNDAPVVTTNSGSASFTAGDNTASTPVIIDGGITVTDIDNTTLVSAKVKITGNFNPGEDVLLFVNNGSTMGNITASYNAGTGLLTLSSSGNTATIAQWQTALRSVTYTSTAVTPNTATRTISFTANDGTAASNTATRTVTVTATDQMPIVTTNSGTTSYSSTAIAIDNGIAVSDLDNATLSSATVSIGLGFHNGDALAFISNPATMGNISGNYNADFAVLTLTSSGATATLAQWQAALRSVTFNSSSSNTANRTIIFTVNDGTKNSATAIKAIKFAIPTITSATYDASTGTLVVTGTNFTAASGDDIIANKFTITAEGGTTYTLTDTENAEITSATSFTLVLSATDKALVNLIINRNGTYPTSGSGVPYNIAGAAGFIAAQATVADATGNGITASNVAVPSITSATYDASTGTLVVTGTGFLSLNGPTNDIVANKFTITGEGGATYTLTDTSPVEITSGTSFTIVLSATDKAGINAIINKNGTSSTGGTTYNLAAAEDWAAGADAAVVVADTTGNGITVSNVAVPTITSATYDASTGMLTVTGTGFLKLSGSNNDIVANKFTFTGDGGVTYTLTDTQNAEITSGTSFTIVLSATDKAGINAIINKNGTLSTGGTTYNLVAAEDWAAGADAAVVVSDTTGNGITVSNIAVPTITSATYDASTGMLTVTGTGFLKLSGANNDIVANKFTFTGEGGATYTLTDTSPVEITSGTSFTITLSATDKAGINQIVNKNGTSSTGGTTYNLAASEDWAAGADAAVVVADTTGNGITVSNVAVPSITSATYDASTGMLTVTGTGFLKLSGANNDIVANKFTFTGEGGATYTLTNTANVDITSGTSFTITLSADDKAGVIALLNKNGTTSGAITYNLAAAEDWAAGADAPVAVADTNGNGITVSNADQTAPAISSVSVPANATYLASQNLDFTVNFDEDVIVNTGGGTPYINITIGSTACQAAYISGSGTSALKFRYTVQNGNEDTNGITVGALSLNSATIKDATGNNAVLTLNSGSTALVLVDAVAPTVAITSDVNTLKKEETAEITFTFSEAPGSSFSWDGSSGDITVTDGTLSAISGSGTIYTATFTPTDDTDGGTASITVAANSYTDVAGNGGTAGTTPSLTFDTKAPTTTVATLALSNDSGSSNTDFITNVAAQTISGTLSANLQTGETVEISLDNGNTWSIASATTGQNTYSLNGVTLTGSHTLQARVKDLAGNINTAVFSQAYVLDTTAPDAPGTPDLATASDSGSSSTDNLTNNTTPEFTGTTALNTIVNVYDGSTLLGAATVSGTSWNYTSTSLTEGSHSITAKATDIAGNVSSASVALAITIDVTAPAIPTGFSVTEENTQNTLNWTANGESDLNTYKIYSGTTANPTVSLTSIVAGTNSFTHTGLNNGITYYYRITATDEAGNESVYSTEESGTPKGTQTITFAVLPSKTYGDADFAPGATASSGLTVTYSSDNTNVAAIVSGNIHIVGAGTATITASQSGNSAYTPASDQTQTLNVSSKKLTAGLISTVSKTYDGSTTATLNNANYSLPGVVNSDEVNLNNPTTGSYDNKNVGNGKTVSVNGLSISGADANNYELTATTASANIGAITTKTLTITATGISKEYDGNALATVNLSDDRVNGDDISASYTATFDNKNVGLAKPISVTAISISGADKDNYTFNTTASATADITAKALAITATGINKVYDGNTTATVNLSDDRVNGDDISASYTATFDNKNVGSAKAVSVTGISISGADKDNYTFNSTASTTADITAKALTINATGINKEYDGNTLATVSLSDDRVSSDEISASYTATFDNKNVGMGKAVSVTGISISGTDKDNYTFNSTAGTTADITAKALTVTATGINKVYEGNTTATVTLSDDRVNNDDITSAYSSAIFNDKNVGTGKAVSVNGIGISGADAGNYTFNTTASATADITAKALAITATGINKVYDGNTTATVNLSDDRVNGDDISASYTATFDNKNVGSAKPISVTGISISGADKDNYIFNTTASTTADITAKTLTVTATGISKEYDGNTLATVSLSDDRVNGDEISASYTATFDNKNVGMGKAVSVTGISISGADKDNYTFNKTTSASADITAKPLTITADDKEKYEGETNPDLTASYNGFITGEDSAVLDVQPVMNTIADENSLQGTYPITVSGASAQNYSISYVPGTLTVLPGAPTSVSLAQVTLYENQVAGTQAGTLSSTSLSPTATYTYTLVSGTGDEDNSSFAINGNQLVTATPLNFESKQTYNIRVRSTTQYNLSLEQTFTVNLEDVNEAPTLDAVADQRICYTTARQDVALTGISAGPDAGQTVTVTANSSNNALLSELSINNNELRYRIADGQSGTATITVTVKDNGGTANDGTDEISRTFTLTVNPLPVSTISSDRGNSISKGETAVLTVASDNGTAYSWSSASGIISGQNSAVLTVRPMETTTYTVVVTNANGCQSSATYTLIVNDDYQALKAENFFTPNGDGINDGWVVKNIDAYPNHTLTIFDRSGRKLYEVKNYQNDWDGKVNGSDLQEGTYYYIFRFDDPKIAPKQGFITIVR